MQTYKTSDYATGFVKGSSIINNAEVHLNKNLVIKYDIKDFFPSISFS